MFAFATTRIRTPVISGDNLLIRCPQMHDYQAWLALRSSSREFLQPFEPIWSSYELTPRGFAERVSRSRQQAQSKNEYSFLIFDTSGHSDALIGGMTLSNIRRRSAQNCTLGYWMGQKFSGKHFMTRAVAQILPFVFNSLSLHRIDAATLPDNFPSRKVLERNNFQYVGHAPYYLQINGKWADHVLYGLTIEQYQALNG